MKTRSERPSHHVAFHFKHFDCVSQTSLTENDIPGASLLGRKSEELKISELKFFSEKSWRRGKRIEDKSRTGEASESLQKNNQR